MARGGQDWFDGRENCERWKLDFQNSLRENIQRERKKGWYREKSAQ
jgi:hypothetical protein